MVKSFNYLTTFPEIIESYFSYSIPGRAIRKNIIGYSCINLRNYTSDKHKTTDDSPYGGGAGMLMKIEPFLKALEENNLTSTTIILPSPKGKVITQDLIQEIASNSETITFLCGHYEGIDDRLSNFATYILSIGDFIIGGGEISAIVITDAIIRLIDGVIGNSSSLLNETFSQKKLSAPEFTKPAEFRGLKVPPILLSGNHEKIKKWREKESLKWSLLLRADLINKKELSSSDKKYLKEIKNELVELIDNLLDE